MYSNLFDAEAVRRVIDTVYDTNPTFNLLRNSVLMGETWVNINPDVSAEVPNLNGVMTANYEFMTNQANQEAQRLYHSNDYVNAYDWWTSQATASSKPRVKPVEQEPKVSEFIQYLRRRRLNEHKAEPKKYERATSPRGANSFQIDPATRRALEEFRNDRQREDNNQLRFYPDTREEGGRAITTSTQPTSTIRFRSAYDHDISSVQGQLPVSAQPSSNPPATAGPAA